MKPVPYLGFFGFWSGDGLVLFAFPTISIKGMWQFVVPYHLVERHVLQVFCLVFILFVNLFFPFQKWRLRCCFELEGGFF